MTRKYDLDRGKCAQAQYDKLDMTLVGLSDRDNREYVVFSAIDAKSQRVLTGKSLSGDGCR